MFSSFHASISKAKAQASETAQNASRMARRASAHASESAQNVSQTATRMARRASANAAMSIESMKDKAEAARASYAETNQSQAQQQQKEQVEETTQCNVIDILPTRQGHVKCGCEKVLIHLQVPPSCYKEIEQPSFMCCCQHCVGVPTALHAIAKKKAEDEGTECRSIDVVDRTCNAVHHSFFYNQNVQVVAGEQHIGFHRLTEKSSLLRFFAKCCHTPLGWRDGNSTVLYGNLIRPGMPSFDEENAINYCKNVKAIGDVFPEPQHAWFRIRAPGYSEPIPYANTKVHARNHAPMAMVHYMRWDALGKRLLKQQQQRVGDDEQGPAMICCELSAGIAVPTVESKILVGWESLRPDAMNNCFSRLSKIDKLLDGRASIFCSPKKSKGRISRQKRHVTQDTSTVVTTMLEVEDDDDL